MTHNRLIAKGRVRKRSQKNFLQRNKITMEELISVEPYSTPSGKSTKKLL